jgi:hypothetical protein
LRELDEREPAERRLLEKNQPFMEGVVLDDR